MSELLKLNHIEKYYINQDSIKKVINDISFSMEHGEFLGIIGASGSGKTTLLNCISTIDTVSAGNIYLDGTDISKINPKLLACFRRENFGFIFQDIKLLNTLTISENIALALKINKVPVQEINLQVLSIAKTFNLTGILNKYPYQVTNSQKQLCVCARAIINKPKLLMADEPSGKLDSYSSQLLLSTMQGINEYLKTAILMVTHNTFSASFASRILFLRDGQIFSELYKGNDIRKVFFNKILDVLKIMEYDEIDEY